MRIIQSILSLILLLSLLVMCSEEEITHRPFPRVKTLAVSNINSEGARFNAEITFRGDFKVLIYGFVWGERENPKLENSDRIVYAENIQESKFSSDIATTLMEKVSYFVRTFVQTDDFIVYGENVEFLSLGSGAPELISFEPNEGMWGDTITIIGKKFSNLLNQNTVLFGSIRGELLSAVDTLLKIRIPAVLNDSSVDVSVSIQGNSVVFADEFNYLIPEVTSIEPLNGTFLDTITITGRHFSRDILNNKVSFNEHNSDIISLNSSEIKCILPQTLLKKNSQISITSEGIEILFPDSFILDPPVIESFEPSIITSPFDLITLKGRNFHPEPVKNSVIIDNISAVVTDATGDQLVLRFPSKIIAHYNVSQQQELNLQLSIGDQSADQVSFDLNWESIWTRKKDFPGTARTKAVGFTIGEKGYFGTGLAGESLGYQLLNDFWEYDPINDEWNQIPDFPGGPRAGASAFVIGNNGYVGLGSENYYWDDPEKDRNHFKDLYSYNSQEGWLRKADFGGIGRHSAASFAIGGHGFIATGWWGLDNPQPVTGSKISDETWEYNSMSDSWIETTNFPGGSYMAAGLTVGNIGYVYNYNSFYYWNDNQWKELSSYQNGYGWWECVAFGIGNKAYVGFGNDHHGGTRFMGEFDPTGETWRDMSINYDNKRFGASAFVINDKAYVIGGYGENKLKDVWEFDPSKPVIGINGK